MRNRQGHALSFTKFQRRAVRLRKTKASLATYEDLMQWYFVETGQLREGQAVAKCSEYITREKVFKMLKIRYNISHKSYGNLKEITLPHAKAKCTNTNSGQAKFGGWTEAAMKRFLPC